MKDKNPLPPFGPYSTIPNWAINHFAKKIGPAATCVWLYLWSCCRWQTNNFDVSVSVASIAKILGIAQSTVAIAINSLVANKLLTETPPKSKRAAKTYTISTYTAEEAKLKAKNLHKVVPSKSVDKCSPIFRVQTPVLSTDFR